MTAVRSERVQSIQLMRAFLGIMVASYHYIYAFTMNIGDGLNVPVSDYQFGAAGMISFFFMSGYIITFASKNDFGSVNGSRQFLVKRFTRILPTYWFSTVLLAAILLFLSLPVDTGVFLKSLLLLPSWAGRDYGFPQPVNYPGWTLFIEMAFYFVYGAGIAFGQRATYILCTVVAVTAVLAGMIFEPQSAILFMLTRPIYLMFLVGIGLAVWRSKGGSMPVWLRVGIIIAAVTIYFTAPYPSGGIDLGWEFLWWGGIPGVLISMAIVGGPLKVPFFPFIDKLGDALFALYLLHIPLAWIWIWGFQKMIVGQPELFFVSLLICSVIFSWYFYHWIEIPLIKKLNAWLGASAKNDRNLQRSGF